MTAVPASPFEGRALRVFVIGAGLVAIPGLSTFPGFLTFPGVPAVLGKLFTPPMRREFHALEGSLRYSFEVAPTVWRDSGGTWHVQESPYDGDLVGSFVLTQSGPVLVDDVTAAELTAAGIGTITEE